MIVGGLDKVTIRQGYNAVEQKFYFQMTEILYDNQGKKYAGQEMRVYVDKEFYDNFHGAVAKITGKEGEK